MSIFLDANILFSGSNANSHLYRLLIWLNDKEKLVTSKYALAEAERNILVKRPNWHETFKMLVSFVECVPEAPLSLDAGLPDKDKPILGTGIAAKCRYLVTGDKRDFGHLFSKTVEGVTVVSILELAEIMTDKHSS